MHISKAIAGWMRVVGVLLIFVGIRAAAPALIPPSKKLTADFGDTSQAWLSPGHTLAVAGHCIIFAMTLIIVGSLADDDPDI